MPRPKLERLPTWKARPYVLSDEARKEILEHFGFDSERPELGQEHVLRDVVSLIGSALGWYLGAVQSGNRSFPRDGHKGRPREDAYLELLRKLRRIFAGHHARSDEEEVPNSRGAKMPLSSAQGDEREFLECALKSAGIKHPKDIRRDFFEPEVASTLVQSEQARMRERLATKSVKIRKATDVPPKPGKSKRSG